MKAKPALTIDALLQQYEPMINRIAYQVGNGKDEDLLQEIRIGVWDAITHFTPERGHMGAYMKKTAWGRAMKYQARESRYQTRHQKPVLSDDEGNVTPLIELLPTKEDVKVEDKFYLRYLLDKLSANDREILELYYNKGYGLKEIAHFVGMPVVTIRTRKKRALTKLSRLWDEEKIL